MALALAEHSLLFLCVAVFAVFFIGVAKAGFGGMIGSLAMPLVASVSDIATAISVLLPTYLAMDIIVAWIYRKTVPFALLWPMAIAGIVGVFLAALVFRVVETEFIALFLGAMSLVLGLRFFVQRRWPTPQNTATKDPAVREWPRLIGLNGASGFTSFFLMGEAPIQMFLLPFRMAPVAYVSLLVWFFLAVNLVKVPLVLAIGLVTIDSLWVSAALLPIMPLGIFVGKAINNRLSKELFYFVVHVLLILLGLYMIGNGNRQF